MQKQRSRDTAPELAFRRELHGRGLRYRIQRPIFDRRRKHDIVFPVHVSLSR
jgi:DNA mismatch endonuclease, patch repair protein